MKQVEIMVIGGGPAGLCAALAASSLGAKVLLAERDDVPGGQLVKQTHKFFGSEKQYAGDRGIQIGQMLLENAANDPNIEIWTDSTVLSIYEDGVVTVEHEGKHAKIKPARVIIATGAAEKFLSFPGNDLPGIYGAGAVQTLMNVAGVKPAERVLMVGAGNIGLIVSYQLKQAGVEVAAVIEGLPTIGGYLVHASKIQRAGIPVLTGRTILEAYGDGQVEGALVAQIDDKWQPIPGTETKIPCDTICLAVGLSPLTELAWQAGCEMAFIRELSGHVPLVDDYLETTRPGIYCAGDVSGIEEASSAMVEGRLAGVSAAASLGYGKEQAAALQKEAMSELDELRAGPMGAHIRKGLEKVAAKGGPKYADQ
jgi:sarcosine oxidase subunit alpha